MQARDLGRYWQGLMINLTREIRAVSRKKRYRIESTPNSDRSIIRARQRLVIAAVFLLFLVLLPLFLLLA